MAFRLIVAAETIYDSSRDDPGLFGEEDAIPRTVLAGPNPEFLDRQRQCYADLAARLVEGAGPVDDWPYLRPASARRSPWPTW